MEVCEGKEYLEVYELPMFECSKEERERIFREALEMNPTSCPEESYLVVDSQGKAVDGFVPPAAYYEKSFLEENPRFVLCWAADCFEEFNIKVDDEEEED